MSAVCQTQEKPEVQEATLDRGYVTPEVNIFELPDRYVLQAEMPGVNKQGLEITVNEDVLTLIGRRPQNTETPVSDLLYRESREADFHRSFELNQTIDTGRIAAKLDQGILTVTLPKVEKAKPRQIAVS